MGINLYIPSPIGFCAGVTNAIDASHKLFSYLSGHTIYFYHKIVHNNYITSELCEKGAVFVDDLNLIPDNSYVVFSAHGVSNKIEDIAKQKNLKIIDLTCPLVHKVHNEAEHYQNLGYDIIYIGTKNHQESKGTLGRLDKSKFYVVESEEDIKNLSFSDSDKIAYVSQTTLNVDKVAKIIKKIKEVLPNIVGNDLNDICSATKNRQAALKNIISNYDIDLVLVIGSKISSNSNKLVEVGGSFLSDSNDLQNKRSSFLIENYKDIDDSWMCGVKNIVLTAGASAPKILIDETINYLRDKFNVAVEEVMYLQERTKFYPPKAFRELEKEYLSQNN